MKVKVVNGEHMVDINNNCKMLDIIDDSANGSIYLVNSVNNDRFLRVLIEYKKGSKLNVNQILERKSQKWIESKLDKTKVKEFLKHYSRNLLQNKRFVLDTRFCEF